jgi:hypothetical protein
MEDELRTPKVFYSGPMFLMPNIRDPELSSRHVKDRLEGSGRSARTVRLHLPASANECAKEKTFVDLRVSLTKLLIRVLVFQGDQMFGGLKSPKM